MANDNTRDQILNAAEKLFSVEGFHGTSVRAITNEAGVNVASVNYHFGSKEALLEALFEYRFRPLNDERTLRINALMKDAKKSGDDPSTADIIDAFLSPLFERIDKKGRFGKMSALVHMAHVGQDTTVMQVIVKTFSGVMKLLFKALKQANPDIPEDQLRWKMHFFIGGFTHTIRITEMQGRGMQVPMFPRKIERKELVAMMVRYFTAGIES